MNSPAGFVWHFHKPLPGKKESWTEAETERTEHHKLSPTRLFCFLEYISSESSSDLVLEIWDWDDEWEGFGDLSSETAMSTVVLGLLSSTVTKIQALPSQVSIAIGLKKKNSEKEKKKLYWAGGTRIVWKLTS